MTNVMILLRAFSLSENFVMIDSCIINDATQHESIS